MDRDEIFSKWTAQLEIIERLGGETDELIVEPPATEAEIAQLERELGATLPPVMRNTLLTFSRGISLEWSLPKGFQLPEAVKRATWGYVKYSLDDILQSELERRIWAKDCVASWELPKVTALWENKIAFYTMGNGDFLTVDVSTPGHEPVVYLSHEGEEEEDGYVLGADFNDFLTRWTGVGCPGPESWIMAPFTHEFTKPLDPDCENAVLWWKAVGLS